MHHTKIKKWGLSIFIGLPIIPIGIGVLYLNRYMGIDMKLRLYLSGLLVFIYLAIMTLGFYFINKRRKMGSIAISVIAALALVGSGYFAYINIRVYGSLNQMIRTQSEVNYSLVSMVDGEINRESDLEGRNIGTLNLSDGEVAEAIESILEKKELINSNQMMIYDSPMAMVYDLYNGEIDAMVIGSQFISIFSDHIELENIENEMQILDSFTIFTENMPLNNSSITDEPFSVLLLGTNSMMEGEIDFGQVNTLILLTINPQNLSVTMTSVPRDSYVTVPCFNHTKDKLSHTHNSGTSCVIETVEHMFNIEIPYYVKLNFRGMVALVDTLGGIEVDVPVTIHEQNSRRQFGDHMITVEEGIQHLDGEQALALSRHRKTLPNDDLGRAGHQQLVLEGILNKLLSEVSTVNEVLEILNVLGENVDTNFSMTEITAMVQYLLELVPTLTNINLLDEVHIKNMVLSGEVGLVQTEYYSFPLSVIYLFEGAIADARELMLINLEKIEPSFNYAVAYDGFENNVTTQWIKTYYDEFISF